MRPKSKLTAEDIAEYEDEGDVFEFDREEIDMPAIIEQIKVSTTSNNSEVIDALRQLTAVVKESKSGDDEGIKAILKSIEKKLQPSKPVPWEFEVVRGNRNLLTKVKAVPVLGGSD